MKEILNTLYIQTQGTYLRLDHETLKIEVEKAVKSQVPLHHLGGIVTFGNVLMSPFLIHKCAEDGRNVVWLTGLLIMKDSSEHLFAINTVVDTQNDCTDRTNFSQG